MDANVSGVWAAGERSRVYTYTAGLAETIVIGFVVVLVAPPAHVTLDGDLWLLNVAGAVFE